MSWGVNKMTQLEKLSEIETLVYKKFKPFIKKLIQVINEDFGIDVINITTIVDHTEIIKSFKIILTLENHDREKLNKICDYIKDNTDRNVVFVGIYNGFDSTKLQIKIKSPEISEYINKLQSELDKV